MTQYIKFLVWSFDRCRFSVLIRVCLSERELSGQRRPVFWFSFKRVSHWWLFKIYNLTSLAFFFFKLANNCFISILKLGVKRYCQNFSYKCHLIFFFFFLLNCCSTLNLRFQRRAECVEKYKGTLVGKPQENRDGMSKLTTYKEFIYAIQIFSQIFFTEFHTAIYQKSRIIQHQNNIVSQYKLLIKRKVQIVW